MKLVEKSNYLALLPFLTKVKINHYFAKSVLTQRANGKVYVDNETSPSSFYIVSGYGMSLLFGKTNNHEFNLKLRDYLLNTDQQREQEEWLQVYPQQWSDVLNKLCGCRLVGNTNFSADEKLNYVVQFTRINSPLMKTNSNTM